jgi:hypothetical protein
MRRLLLSVLFLIGAAGPAQADDCHDIRRALALAREARLPDDTLVALERRHCAHTTAARPAQSACEDLTVMSVLARMSELEVDAQRAIEGARAVHCSAEHLHETRFDRWAPGARARGSSGEWYYPNGRLARARDGRWYYASGRPALRWGGTWYYPNGLVAHRPEGEWRFADGTRARGLVEIAGSACAIIAHPVCSEVARDRHERIRDVEIMELVWDAGRAAEVNASAAR